MRGFILIAAVMLAGLASAGPASALTLTSAEIKSNGKIADEQAFNSFGCTGQNVSPSLSWSGAPKGTKSFAVTVYDPDAPTGSGFWHWVVANIPADVTSLAKGAGSSGGTMPAGALQIRTDYGAPGYGGPCPPKGDKPHHYHITVFAVNVDKLDVDANSTAAVVGFNLHYHTLAKAQLIGLYGR